MNTIKDLDRKIIYELGRNARISYQELADKIKSKKTVVAYHFQQLQQQNIFWKFVPVISLSRLGIYTYKIYFKFHGLTKDNQEKMLRELVDDHMICWVAKTTGMWDLLIGAYAYNILDFAQIKNSFFKKYGNYIQAYSVTIIEDALVFNRDYLLSKRLDYRQEFIFGGPTKIDTLDDKEKDILRLICNNARFQTTEIAQKLTVDVKTVMAKVKNLEKRQIIQGYTTFLRVNNLGLQFFKVCVYLQDYTDEKYHQLLLFCKSNRAIIHIIKSIGDWELELEIEAEKIGQIYDLIEDLKTKFPHIIKQVDVVIINHELKLDFFPEWY